MLHDSFSEQPIKVLKDDKYFLSYYVYAMIMSHVRRLGYTSKLPIFIMQDSTHINYGILLLTHRVVRYEKKIDKFLTFDTIVSATS